MRGKLALSAFVALVVCLGLAYMWGASGRVSSESALEDTRQYLDLAEARVYILDARVSLYNINFGDASRHLEEAKVPLRRARERYQDARQREAVAGIDRALNLVEEAQRLAGKLDQAGNTKAGEALEAIRVAASKH